MEIFILIIQVEYLEERPLIIHEIYFSSQSNGADDTSTSSISLQLNDNPPGITMNRAVTNNLTFNSIGDITAYANLNVWGELFFQHSSSVKEALNGSIYDLDIRNGDTVSAINIFYYWNDRKHARNSVNRRKGKFVR